MPAYPPTPVASPKVRNSRLVGHPERSSNNLGVFTTPSTPESMTKSPTSTTDELCSRSPATSGTNANTIISTTTTTTAAATTNSTSTTAATASAFSNINTSQSDSDTPSPTFTIPSRHSSTPREPRATFNSLPPLIQLQILELALHDSGYATLTPNLLDFSDPRFINHNFFTLLDRRNVWSRLLLVNKLSHAFFTPKLYSPAVVTSMAQLNSLSGYSYPEHDQKKKGRQNPMFHTGDFNPHDSQTNVPCHVKRKRVGERSTRKVRELVLIIANLPGMFDSNVGLRFPEWYIQDWMRYDLEALGVESLTVLAPSKAIAANILHATLPNHETIKHIHMEVFTGEPFFAPDVRFYNHYTHDPSTDHICPRLVLHSQRLESLTIRNMHVCRHLFDNHDWPNLRFLNVFFHCGNRGLCSSDTLANETWFAENEVFETYTKLWGHCIRNQDFLVRLNTWFDVPTRSQGEADCCWRTTHGCMICRSVPKGPVIANNHEWWKALAEGTHRFRTPSPSLSMTTRFMNDSEEVEDGSEFDEDVENVQELQYPDESDGYFDLENSVDESGIMSSVPRHSETNVTTAPLFTLLPKKPRQMKIL